MTDGRRDKVDITESDIINILQGNTNADKRITIEELCDNLYDGKGGISGGDNNNAKKSHRKSDRLKSIKLKLERLFAEGNGCIGIFDPIRNRELDNEFQIPDKAKGLQQCEVYYKQNFTKVEAFMIYSGLYNQDSIPSIKIEQIVDKLVKNTSDSEFQKMAKNITLESDHKSVVENFRSDPEIVMKNIELILNSMEKHKKITFERIYYSFDNRRNRWETKLPDPAGYNGKLPDYTCTPFKVFVSDGRYWVLVVMDKYNTETGDFTIFPTDLLRNIKIKDEDACKLEDIKFFKDKYKSEKNISNIRLDKYMKTNYDKPEKFVIKIRKNETSGTLIFRTFGMDFDYDKEQSDEVFDVITVIRSPYGMINWALVNLRDVVVIPTVEKTRKDLKKRITELYDQYYQI